MTEITHRDTADPEAAPVTADVLVARQRRPARTMPVPNPARVAEVVGAAAIGEAGHVEMAVDAAAAAAPGWAALAPAERGKALGAAADAIEPHVAHLATLLTREQGKVLWESRLDVGGAAHILRYYAGLAGELDERVIRDDDRARIWRARRPMGVAGVIVPWNSPVYLCFLGLAPALLGGNTAVVKPSEYAPLALTEVLRLAAEVLPAGVLNVVPGAADAGEAIARHDRIRKIFFTGSIATGQSIMRNAAGNLKRLSLELGGNDPAIVLDSARVSDRMCRELVRAVFTLSGQVCYGVKRIYVHRARYDEFLDRYLAAVDELVVGDGLDPQVSLGPLNNRRQFERVRDLVASTAASGASVHVRGRKADPAGWDRGYFLLPAVVTDLPDTAELVRGEQFGPVVPVLPFDTDDEVVARANATEYGLASSVWGDDAAHARAVAARLESGSVFINAHRIGASDVSMPFGGFKRSGIGRNHGLAALEACTELQILAEYRDVSAFPGPPTQTGPLADGPQAEAGPNSGTGPSG
jgi:aldehyde dehydrogenase